MGGGARRSARTKGALGSRRERAGTRVGSCCEGRSDLNSCGYMGKRACVCNHCLTIRIDFQLCMRVLECKVTFGRSPQRHWPSDSNAGARSAALSVLRAIVETGSSREFPRVESLSGLAERSFRHGRSRSCQCDGPWGPAPGKSNLGGCSRCHPHAVALAPMGASGRGGRRAPSPSQELGSPQGFRDPLSA